MEDNDILQLAIDQALANNWGVLNDYKYRNLKSIKQKVITPLNKAMYWSVLCSYTNTSAFDADYTVEHKFSVEEILFNPYFARAFFGDKPMMMGEIKIQGKPVAEGDEYLMWGGNFYEFKLICLSIARPQDRIKYLEKYLKPVSQNRPYTSKEL